MTDENATKNEDIVKSNFIAKGTTCESCGKIIKNQAIKVDGVKEIEFDYATETGYVTYDRTKTNIDEIMYQIEKKGYTCSILDEASGHSDSNRFNNTLPKSKSNKTMGWTFAIIGILIVGYFLFRFTNGINMPTISQNMSYGLLFLVGLLTGFHCVSMCGGFVLSYTTNNAKQGIKSHKSHLMYGLGKTVSYTLIGAIFGLIGSIFTFTPMMRGVIGLLAGLFLILFGLKMLNVIPILRKIQIKTPQFLNRLVGEKSKDSGPLVIGLLNGLMIACGPLQAIYIMAAGTGSMLEGGKLLFVFALGTLPVMLGFGYFASFVSNKMTHKILKASGIIVILLGIFMINNGLVLTGTGYDINSIVTGFSAQGQITGDAVNDLPVVSGGYQEIEMEVNRYGWEPDKFVLKKGVPVRWIINGKEINSCNNAIQVPKYGLKFDIKQGEQVIEFTPTEEGVVSWSCWMGMIPGTFIVKDDINLNDAAEVQKELESVPQQKAGSCGGGSGGGCGSSTCGAARGGGCGCGG